MPGIKFVWNYIMSHDLTECTGCLADHTLEEYDVQHSNTNPSNLPQACINSNKTAYAVSLLTKNFHLKVCEELKLLQNYNVIQGQEFNFDYKLHKI
jgi:hypothetical protein